MTRSCLSTLARFATFAVLMFGVGLAGAAGAADPESARKSASRDDVRKGKVLAQKWCAGCHTEARADKERADGELPGVEDIPSFAEIAAKDETDEDRLRATLAGGHRQMPTDKMADEDIEALIAYILSLKKK